MTVAPKSLDHLFLAREGEARFQAQIITVARLHGWRLIYHTHDSRRSQPGFPDLVMLRAGRGFAIEVKVGRRVVTEEQQRWLDAFALVPGFDSYVARPGNFIELERRLA